MQRTNHLKITIALVIAGLIVFAAFKLDSYYKETARELRILQYVKHSLDCYQPFDKEDDSMPGAADSNSGSKANQLQETAKTNACPVQREIDRVTLQQDVKDLVNGLLVDVESLKKIQSEKKSDKEKTKEIGVRKSDVENKLKALLSLPYLQWFPAFSMAAYDSLIASGDFYLIPSDTLREKLTRLKLLQEQFGLLEGIYKSSVDKELRPFWQKYKLACLSDAAKDGTKNLRKDTPVGMSSMMDRETTVGIEAAPGTDTPVGAEGVGDKCIERLTDEGFVEKIKKLEELIKRKFVLRSSIGQMYIETIEAIPNIKGLENPGGGEDG